MTRFSPSPFALLRSLFSSLHSSLPLSSCPCLPFSLHANVVGVHMFTARPQYSASALPLSPLARALPASHFAHLLPAVYVPFTLTLTLQSVRAVHSPLPLAHAHQTQIARAIVNVSLSISLPCLMYHSAPTHPSTCYSYYQYPLPHIPSVPVSYIISASSRCCKTRYQSTSLYTPPFPSCPRVCARPP